MPRKVSELALDIGTAVLRIEQLSEETDDRGQISSLGLLLFERLQDDAKRLRGHLDPAMIQAMEDVQHDRTAPGADEPDPGNA